MSLDTLVASVAGYVVWMKYHSKTLAMALKAAKPAGTAVVASALSRSNRLGARGPMEDQLWLTAARA